MAAADKSPTADAAAQGDEATDIFTVAPRRSVHTDDGVKGAGEEVLLTLTEARRLMPLGFLVDPDAEPITEANGPTFGRG